MALHAEIIDEHTSTEIESFETIATAPSAERPTLERKRRIYSTALNNLAYQHARVENGDLDRALMDVDRALELSPPALRPEFLDTKATVLLRRGSPEDALAVINEATSLAPNRVDFQIRAVEILASLGRSDEARIRAQEALLGLERNGRSQSRQAEELNLLIEKLG